MGSSIVQSHTSYTLQIPFNTMPSVTLPTPPDSPTGVESNSYAMRKYTLLNTQHQELREHLDQVRATASFSPSTTTTSSYTSTPAISPTRSTCSPFGQYPSTRRHSRHRRSSVAGPPKALRGSTSLCSLPDESILYQLAEEEQRLFDLNEAIKRSLMELLNGDHAKHDGEFRTWVQCRLMDTEKELRSERRRKSAP